MGCDIHVFIEIKVKGDWITYSKPLIKRDYHVFSLIGNVRNTDNIDPITDNKPLPADLSIMASLAEEYDRKTLATHSHTWLNVNEIKQLVKSLDWRWEHEQLGYLFGNGIGDWSPKGSGYPTWIEDVRMICWFDN